MVRRFSKHKMTTYAKFFGGMATPGYASDASTPYDACYASTRFNTSTRLPNLGTRSIGTEHSICFAIQTCLLHSFIVSSQQAAAPRTAAFAKIE